MRISSSKLKVVFKFNTTAHEVRQRAICNNCGVTGNNTYQIVYPGNSSSRRLRLLDVAMDGAGVRSAKMFNPINDFVFLPYRYVLLVSPAPF